MTADARQRAVTNSQNGGTCIISGAKDGSVKHCHVLPRATESSVLTSLEWWWGMKKESLNVDSSRNQAFLRADLHVLWDRGYIAILPLPGVVKEYLEKWQDGGRHIMLEVSRCKPIIYLVAGARPQGNSAIRRGFTYGFNKLKLIQSHASPVFMILNAAIKIKENKELWVKAMKVVYGRLHINVDASRVADDILTLSDLWTAPHPREAQSIRKEEKGEAVEDAPSLPVIVPSGEPMTPKRAKAPVGPGGLEMDKCSELKAHKPEGEPYVSNLKSFAAQLASTGSRCLLSLHENKSIQCCHVIPRRTTDDRRKRLAAWWGLVDLDINSPFNIFLLRADIHYLWDKGHLIFVPEPRIIEEYLKQDIVPIDVGMSLDELFQVCDGPVYRYCVVSHCDLPDTKRNAAVPREFKAIGWMKSRVPPPFAIYNAGLALSMDAEPIDFTMALDAFYKKHKVKFKAIDVPHNMGALVYRWISKMPNDESVPLASQDALFN
ncbi:hypothetical protein IEO21_10245 [Rhodonia placenta]|uniref:HNH nuclease domain-containing protein n=1 Tax=Rhodonia placenta TaxID=104341 RepID=A0A8H7NSU3_9APHY|nr:hypothetical protein IEO21_10245 [Postia placenta]